MLVFDFDPKMRLQEIEKHFQQVEEIRNSLAEYRAKYRKLSAEIKIDSNSLLTCCETFERSLLINCYTFSEQLTKNLIYELIQKDKHCNQYVNMFIDHKVPDDKFSPNVYINQMQSIVRELHKEFKFTLPNNLPEFAVYDEMVRCRHRYAHKGIYAFDFDNFGSVIKVLSYTSFELAQGKNRFAFQRDIEELKKITPQLSRIDCQQKASHRYAKEMLKEVRKKCRIFYNKYSNDIEKIALMGQLLGFVKKMCEIDLRSISSAIDAVKQFNAYYNLK